MSRVLHVNSLGVQYGDTKVLNNINLNVDEKDFLGIIGPNGGGKTTFLKVIMGLIPNYTGEIKLFNADNHKSINYKKIGYVPQFSDLDKSFPISCLEVVMTAFVKRRLNPFMKYNAEHIRIANINLMKLDIGHLAHRQINELSGGEFQRLLIARALACSPELLILDEPTASVDPTSKKLIYELLKELNKDLTIIMVTHDLFAISNTVKKIACLNGNLVYHGIPDLEEDTIDKLYNCPVDIIGHDSLNRLFRKHIVEEKQNA